METNNTFAKSRDAGNDLWIILNWEDINLCILVNVLIAVRFVGKPSPLILIWRLIFARTQERNLMLVSLQVVIRDSRRVQILLLMKSAIPLKKSHENLSSSMLMIRFLKKKGNTKISYRKCLFILFWSILFTILSSNDLFYLRCFMVLTSPLPSPPFLFLYKFI